MVDLGHCNNKLHHTEYYKVRYIESVPLLFRSLGFDFDTLHVFYLIEVFYRSFDMALRPMDFVADCCQIC